MMNSDAIKAAAVRVVDALAGLSADEAAYLAGFLRNHTNHLDDALDLLDDDLASKASAGEALEAAKAATVAQLKALSGAQTADELVAVIEQAEEIG